MRLAWGGNSFFGASINSETVTLRGVCGLPWVVTVSLARQGYNPFYCNKRGEKIKKYAFLMMGLGGGITISAWHQNKAV
jgi:hypothetical protein